MRISRNTAMQHIIIKHKVTAYTTLQARKTFLFKMDVQETEPKLSVPNHTVCFMSQI